MSVGDWPPSVVVSRGNESHRTVVISFPSCGTLFRTGMAGEVRPASGMGFLPPSPKRRFSSCRQGCDEGTVCYFCSVELKNWGNSRLRGIVRWGEQWR